jgi:hypothetical protein
MMLEQSTQAHDGVGTRDRAGETVRRFNVTKLDLGILEPFLCGGH